MAKKFRFTSIAALMATIGLSSCAVQSETTINDGMVKVIDAGKPFVAQVVGVQWLNPYRYTQVGRRPTRHRESC